MYPIKREGDGPTVLEDFIRDHGSPFILRNDVSQMQSGKLWTSICRKYNISQTFTEPNHPQQNPAERYIGHVKDLVIKILDRTGAPDKFWALCGTYVVYILNRMAHPLLDNRTPFERRHGYTPDISAILHFSFWDPVYFYDSETTFPQTRERIGYFVGFTESIGDALTYWVFDTDTQQVLVRSIVRLATVPNKRLDNNVFRDHDRVGQIDANRTTTSPVPLLVGHTDLVPTQKLVEFDPMDHSGYPAHLGDPLPNTTPTSPNSSLISQVTLGTRLSIYWPDDDAYYPGTVTGKSTSGLVQISYDDGNVEELDLATETFRILSHTGTPTTSPNSSCSLSHLVDSNTTPDTDDADRWKMIRILDHKDTGPHKTEFKVQWDSGETSWLPLSIVKRSDPNLYGDYALTAHGPWANTFRRQFHSLCNSIFKTSTVLYKYGYRLPRSSKEALELDKAAGNTLWADAIHKEMTKIEKFNVFKESSSVPTGYERLRYMLIFDIKLDGTHKARLVADGSGSPLSSDAYSSVIAPDHVRLVLVAATINGLDHAMIDLENAYLHALTKELAYTYLPLEFGNLGGKTLLIFAGNPNDIVTILHVPFLFIPVVPICSLAVILLSMMAVHSLVPRPTLQIHGKRLNLYALSSYSIMTVPWQLTIILKLTTLLHLTL